MRRLLYRLGLVQLVWFYYMDRWMLRIVRRDSMNELFVYPEFHDRFYLKTPENRFKEYKQGMKHPGRSPKSVGFNVYKDEVVKALVERELSK